MTEIREHASQLSQEERESFLDAARKALRSHLKTGHDPGSFSGLDQGRLGAAFVTLKRGQELRGCLGNLSYDRPLMRTITECVVAAASSDIRFSPVTEAELPELEISVSVLSEFRKVSGPEDIQVGQHGILISRGGQRGLLLPQVATELDLDAVTFLELTCQKASLGRDCWKKGAEIRVFTAEVFSGPAE